MKIAVVPDMAMMVVNMINKTHHECLYACNISEDDLKKHDVTKSDNAIDYNKPPFNMEGYNMNEYMKYVSFDEPSGVKGRLILYDNIIKNAEAAIIINDTTKKKDKMYNTLNELILFSCISCHNAHNIVVHNIRNKNIPRLELSYPTTYDELVKFIRDIHEFLENVDDMNSDTVVDMRVDEKPVSLDVVSDIFKNKS